MESITDNKDPTKLLPFEINPYINYKFKEEITEDLPTNNT